MSALNNSALIGASGSTGYQISRSVRLRSSASAYFNRTFSTPTLSTKWTWSGWVKRGTLGAAQTLFGGSSDVNNWGYIGFLAGDTLTFQQADAASVTSTVTTTQVFRDPSAWYHIVVAFDSTQATAANRLIMYVNGVQITAFGTATYLAQNTASRINQAVAHTIYRLPYSAANYVDGYLTEANFIDGQALTPSSFGETNTVTGVWQPKKYAGTYGTNGFYLNFSDNTSPTNVITGNSGIGRDFSGNGNYWISNNVSLYGGTTQSFTSTGTTSWTAPAGVTSVQYLIVGGGGGGTNYSGGGGGSVVTGTMSVTPGSSYSVTVGAGGSGGVTPTDGADSAFAGVTATKGLKAASAYVGGASGSGFAGGTGANLANPYLGGGGGGAGGAGNNRSGTTAGAGGVGVSVTIGSTTSTYGGGGGGGAEGAGSRGVGGSGGGGNGSGPVGSPAGSAGTANTGGGGGGGDGGNTTSGFAGGSGTVILAYGSSVTYDSMLDVPTQWADGGNGRGNYAVSNPINAASGLTVSDGNLKIAASAGGSKFVNSSISFPSSGAYYAEITFANASTNLIGQTIGIALGSRSLTAAYNAAGSYHFYASNTGSLLSNGTETSGLSAISANEVFQVAVDVTNSKMWIGRSNVWYNSTGGTTGNPSTGANPTFTAAFVDFFVFAGFDTGSSVSANLNFGQRPFAYTPPTGFKALNTLNLPTPTILKGNQYFDATTYTGNASTNTIVNAGGFQPDLVWLKSRSAANNHTIFDSIRGANNILYPNLTNVAAAVSQYLNSFNSNGFTLGANENSNDTVGESSVGWQWRAGAGSSSSNTAGSVTSTVSVNPTAGISVLTYTESGTYTVGHGLGVAPSMIILKERNAVGNWIAWTNYWPAPTTRGLYLNGTSAAFTTGANWLNSATSTVFGITGGQVTSGSSQIVAYVFAEIAGFSRFGTYTGNGSTDGPFVFCGFRPRFLMFKRTDAAAQWLIIDTTRSPYNQTNEVLLPSSSAAEANGAGYGAYDILSNGFKPRNVVANDTNVNGGIYIFAAFAEFPFKNALAR